MLKHPLWSPSRGPDEPFKRQHCTTLQIPLNHEYVPVMYKRMEPALCTSAWSQDRQALKEVSVLMQSLCCVKRAQGPRAHTVAL